MSCHTIGNIVLASFFIVTVLCIAGYYGWRRTQLPWRSIWFVIYVVCGLLLINASLLTVLTLASPPATGTTSC